MCKIKTGSCRVRIRFGFGTQGSDSDRFRHSGFGFGSVPAPPGSDSDRIGLRRFGFETETGSVRIRGLGCTRGGGELGGLEGGRWHCQVATCDQLETFECHFGLKVSLHIAQNSQHIFRYCSKLSAHIPCRGTVISHPTMVKSQP